MRSSRQVEVLAPILQAMRSPKPAWREIAQQLLAYANLPPLITLIKGIQDWRAIALLLLDYLEREDAHCQRATSLIRHLDGHPKDYARLAELSSFKEGTVRQTISALRRGGYEILEETSGGKEGRPIKAFYVLPSVSK